MTTDVLARLRVLRPLALALACGCLLWSAAPAHAADDKEAVDAAKQLAKDLDAARKAEDGAAVSELVGKVAGVHNGIEHGATRKKLQKAVGDVLKDKDLADVAGKAIDALAALDDAKGAWKQLKRHVPGAKDKEPMDDKGRAALEAVAKLAPESAVGTLEDLAEKSRDYPAAALAIAALGHYGKAKKRTAILESLVKLISRFQPPRGVQVGEETMKRWGALGEPLVVACNRLTNRKETSPDAWITLWRENKKRPQDLFND